MKTPPPACFLAVSALLLIVGCATTDSVDNRIKQNSAIYAGLTPEEQNQIHSGIITAGFTPEMVLMALGKPERILPGKGPGEEDWVYVNMYSQDGRSIAMATKITASVAGSSQRIDMVEASKRHVPIEYNLDYDLANEAIKAESAIKVHVKFTEGTVSDIQILTDGKG